MVRCWLSPRSEHLLVLGGEYDILSIYYKYISKQVKTKKQTNKEDHVYVVNQSYD